MTTHRHGSLAVRVGAAAGAVALGICAAIIPLSPAVGAPARQVTVNSTASECEATVALVAQWPGGFMASVTIRNLGTSTWPNWWARVTLPPGYTIYRPGAHLDPYLFYGYGELPPGQVAEFGFIASGSGFVGPIGVVCGST